MLQIGVMLDSLTTSAWVGKIIEDIQGSDIARVSLVVLNTPVQPKAASFRKRLKSHWKLTAFSRYERWDYERNRYSPDAKAPADLSALLLDVAAIKVVPERAGFTDRIPESDLANIRAANLDVIFRFGFRIIRGGILEAARYGVWSFHHDDNMEYRGGPPLFWEIYEGNPISGSVLQRLTDTLDGGRVLYRSHSSTNFSSLYLNRNPIYWKTAEFAMRRLRDLHDRGWSYLESLPTYSEPNTYDRRIYRTPDARQMSTYAARRVGRSIRGRLQSGLQGSSPHWFVAIRKRSDEHAFDDSVGYEVIRPPKDRFYADPFLFKHAGRTYLIFEDFRYSEDRAGISCAELDSEGKMGPIVEMLRRPYHLSYPFVFERDGEIYMIPESKQNRTIELYRAEEFPTRWNLETLLLTDIQAVDATIHEQDGKLWMFTGITNGRYSSCDELGIFYADALTGPWLPHPGNPVISDVRRARPGGALFVDEGRLIRPAQDCGKTYGYALQFSEVLRLNEREYEERLVGRIEPTWIRGNQGTHTYSRTDEFEVIDGKFPLKMGKRIKRSG